MALTDTASSPGDLSISKSVENGEIGLEMADQHPEEDTDIDGVFVKSHDEEERLDSTSDLVTQTYRMYRMRWYIVLTMVVLNISNAMVSMLILGLYFSIHM